MVTPTPGFSVKKPIMFTANYTPFQENIVGILHLPHVKVFTSTFTFPESMINLTPSIVTDVSAMFVETIHFLTPSGAMSNT